MSEQQVIQAFPLPITKSLLASGLQELGVTTSMPLMVHSSMSSLGWVCGGAETIISGLMQVVGAAGTLMMPAHSGGNSEPSHWRNPPVPQEWWPIIREEMPAYDPLRTPTRGIGVVAELFRTFPGVKRSAHPALSFAAWGAAADRFIAGQSIDYSMGEQSPLARLYDEDGWILLLGAGYESNTCFHLAEYRSQRRAVREYSAAMMEGGERIWRVYKDIEFNSDVFPAIGDDLEQQGYVRIGKIGGATCRLFPVRAAVDAAVSWLRHH